ncbi:uncharacterized protein LOC125208406 [Salvia hispanica]|uniref:uncharacterized protein LOC125208406 n=1 Tax=Salvia hispanica TaxID=49212 RepID=UPI00200940DD|nr:uncharacterized protein LOC125208406 [Salvia hispanica]
MDYARVSGSVKGLICVSSSRAMQPIAICNPFLGQLKILPHSPSSSCHSPQCIIRHHVGVGFDEDYKVVQLVSCQQHRRLQANLYLKRTNSWRGLAIDQEFVIDSSIMSFFKHGSFAHWRGGLGEERIILSFDMKNEVFQTIRLPDEMVASEYEILVCNHACHPNEIFSLCDLENGFKLRVYESTEVGDTLSFP